MEPWPPVKTDSSLKSCYDLITQCVPESSVIALLISLGPTDNGPSSRIHTPSALLVPSLCSSPLIWAGDTLAWNRDLWNRSTTSSLEECVGDEAGDRVRVSSRCSVDSTWIMGSDISLK